MKFFSKKSVVRVLCPKCEILLVDIPAKIKMIFISKDDCFAEIGIFGKSIAGPLQSVVQATTIFFRRKDKTIYIPFTK